MWKILVSEVLQVIIIDKKNLTTNSYERVKIF
jgi:hypothetical protein